MNKFDTLFTEVYNSHKPDSSILKEGRVVDNIKKWAAITAVSVPALLGMYKMGDAVLGEQDPYELTDEKMDQIILRVKDLGGNKANYPTNNPTLDPRTLDTSPIGQPPAVLNPSTRPLDPGHKPEIKPAVQPTPVVKDPRGNTIPPALVTAASNVAKNNKWNVKYLLAVIGFETGGSYSPSQKHSGGGSATGLIQFMPTTAVELGTTTDKLAKMNHAQQMVYVEKYLKVKLDGVVNPNLSDMYMAVLWPKAVGKKDTTVIWGNSEKSKYRRQYKANKGLDVNKNGYITKAEAAAKVKPYLIK